MVELEENTAVQPGYALDGLPPEVQEESRRFEREIAALEAGHRDPDDFKRFRLENGVYGIRGTTDLHMVRVKVRLGKLTADQLEALAEIADEFTPNRKVHLTTRQDIQFHYVLRRHLPAVLARITGCGLTTREACGNTVRNVTACPFAGISPTETFDVTPWADALSSYFLRNPLSQNLPRKFKISFEGCDEDHVRTPIHDLGIVAALQDGTPGFRIFVGGGLGSQPRSADLLEEFTPQELFFPTAEAVLRIFDRCGERRPDPKWRARARMKFILREWGIEKFRETILAERKQLMATQSGCLPHLPATEEPPPLLNSFEILPRPSERDYLDWKRNQAIAQKQAGWSSVLVRCPLGDLTSDQMRVLASIARRHCQGRLRTVITQNLLLRWVPELALPALYRELQKNDLAAPRVQGPSDITRCPGADTCQIALTHSRGLAEALTTVFTNGLGDIPEIRDLSIKISGCFNSCGHHHIADLGFYGSSERIDGHQVPFYTMLVGGRTTKSAARFGQVLMKLPARRVPEAVKDLLTYFLQHRLPEETFPSFADRIGVGALRGVLQRHRRVPPLSEAPDLYLDFGEEVPFQVVLGQGECAS